MSYYLFCDDVRFPEEVYSNYEYPEFENIDWVIVRSFHEAGQYIKKNGQPILISIDYDFSKSEDKRNGTYIANFLVNESRKYDVITMEIKAHSSLSEYNQKIYKIVQEIFDRDNKCK